MRIDVLTTFPQMFDSVMSTSMMRIAREKNLLDFEAFDLRDWTHDKHRTTDDEPYGGGQGLVMKCEPIFEAHDALCELVDSQGNPRPKPTTIFLTPAGRPFDDALATSLSNHDRLLFVCGHYEGIDERCYSLADECISLGDYVLTGGELAAMVVIDAVVRKIDGVLGDSMSAVDESFSDGLLEYPHYTRPAEYRGMAIPPVLADGNHAAIATWRRQMSLQRTLEFRPDLLEGASLSDDDRAFLNSLSTKG